MRGFVYVITNPVMNGYCKVGFSINDPNERAKTLNTASPVDYIVEYEAFVDNPQKVEKKSHELLSFLKKEREWFSCNTDVCIKAIKSACDQTNNKIYFDKCENSVVPILQVEPEALPVASLDAQLRKTSSTPKKSAVSKSTPESKNKIVEPVKATDYTAKTIDELLPIALTGDAKAQYELGYRYDKGIGTRKNLKGMFKFYEMAAKQGHEKAMTRVGISYITGRGLEGVEEKSDLMAATYLAKPAIKGDKEAQFEWAKRLIYSGDDQWYRDILQGKEDEQMREYCEQRLDENKHTRMLLTDLGVKTSNLKEYGKKLMLNLHNEGNDQSTIFIAKKAFDFFGESNAYQKQIELYKQLTEKGHSQFYEELARYYYNGYGCDENEALAKECVEKAGKCTWKEFITDGDGWRFV